MPGPEGSFDFYFVSPTLLSFWMRKRMWSFTSRALPPRYALGLNSIPAGCIALLSNLEIRMRPLSEFALDVPLGNRVAVPHMGDVQYIVGHMLRTSVAFQTIPICSSNTHVFHELKAFWGHYLGSAPGFSSGLGLISWASQHVSSSPTDIELLGILTR